MTPQPEKSMATIAVREPLHRQPVGNLKTLLREKAPEFWIALWEATRQAGAFVELLPLCTLRKRAEAAGIEGRPAAVPLRLALIGACSLYPLHELVAHMLASAGYAPALFVGQYDNYAAEILDGSSGLYDFAPDAVLVLPAPGRCRYGGALTDSRAMQQAQATATAQQLLEWCSRLHERTRAEILLCNFPLPTGFDPGAYRTRTLGSDWNFRKAVNLELGLNAPPAVHICDLEFLAYRRGAESVRNPRGWFESKQPCGADLLVDIAREVAVMIQSLRRGPKKVLVLDLDNTLWGGVVGDDGVEGIEIGDTSPAGEAYKAFQEYVRRLSRRGVLLAVCSKNDHAKAAEPFERHPEMVLKLEDFVAFKANWRPKPDNIREIAAELNLGLDSFVFVDDNPAEIDIVRQYVPEVTAIALGPDPAQYVPLLEDSRLFEPVTLTPEDAGRTRQYQQEEARKELLASATDMDAYLQSLGMKAWLCEFNRVDAPRIAQLINKSNQFNLTTRRRTEAEVVALLSDPAFLAFTIRLCDRFGDHGLISVLIAEIQAPVLRIDTWLMSCRVLNRQVEQEALNELVRLAARAGCTHIHGSYLPTAKNALVRDLLPALGFARMAEHGGRTDWELDVRSFHPLPTRIAIERRVYDTTPGDRTAPEDLR